MTAKTYDHNLKFWADGNEALSVPSVQVQIPLELRGGLKS